MIVLPSGSRRHGFAPSAAGMGMAAVALLLVPLVIRNSFYLNMVIMTLFYAALSSAWNIVGGYAGQLSIGHVAYFGIGAYTSTILFARLGVSPWIGALAGGCLAAGVSGLISYPCFRLRGPFFTLSTIAFAEIVKVLAIYCKSITNGSIGIPIPFRPGLANAIAPDRRGYYYAALALLGIVLFAASTVSRSRLGYRLRAIREDEDAAESLGVPAVASKMTAMMLSSFFAAVLGSFSAQYTLFVEPYTQFSMDTSVLMSLMAIIGGLGTLGGPVLGAVILTPLNEFLRAWLGGMHQGLHVVIYGTMLIVVVLLMPDGMVPFLARWRVRIGRRWSRMPRGGTAQ